jgi:CxxC motif-containing protein (DUF1111 family)
VLQGQQLFDQVGCNTCHMDALPLTNHGWCSSSAPLRVREAIS